MHAEGGILDLNNAAETLNACGILDLNNATEILDIYDITNVLEGIGLFEKTLKNKSRCKGIDASKPEELKDDVNLLQMMCNDSDEGKRMPSLMELKAVEASTASMEVILADRYRDLRLRGLEDIAHELYFTAENPLMLTEKLAKLVAPSMGHKEILFKKLIDYVGLPSRVASGYRYCVEDHRSSCLIRVEDDKLQRYVHNNIFFFGKGFYPGYPRSRPHNLAKSSTKVNGDKFSAATMENGAAKPAFNTPS
ncbi:serine/threonine-protein kinase CTR1 [Tanacetum coccineum]